jgi:adenosylmethionine---8-amino-7-oxononanoate aminotransferase
MSESDQFKRLWMPFTYYQDQLEHPPVVIERGEGLYLYDREGRRYIDAIGSWWVTIFGHNHPAITAAVKRQLDKIEHVMMAGFVSEPGLRLSQLLGELLPAPLSRIFYSDDGSTAVEVAMKIALQYHALRSSDRCEFVGLGGAYHGDTLGAMSVGDMPGYHGLFHERFKKHHAVDSPYCYRCPRGKEAATCSSECMDSLERLFTERNEKIAACIFEPMVQGAAGMRIYPVKALERIFSLCERFKILTIADEVATGFGRTGKLFACEHAGRVPDIICLAKGLSGGYLPMGATAVQEHVFEEFRGGYGSERILNHGHSFTGNPLAASAGCAAMELIMRYNIPASLDKIAAYFRKQLLGFDKFDCVGDIRSIGFIGALELVKDRAAKTPFLKEERIAGRISNRALELGLLVRPLGDVLYFMPPYITAENDIDEMFSILERAIGEIVGA